MVANLMETMVHSDRTRITHIESGEALLELAQNDEPALIVMSTNLPKGLFWCGKIRKNSKAGHVPLVVIFDPTHQKTIEQHQQLAVCATSYEAGPLTQESTYAILRRFVPDSLHIDDSAVSADGPAPPIPRLEDEPVVDGVDTAPPEVIENLAAVAIEMEEKEQQLREAQATLDEVKRDTDQIESRFADESELQALAERENDELRDRIRNLEEDATHLEQQFNHRAGMIQSSEERAEHEVENLRALLDSLQSRYEERSVLLERIQTENDRLKDQVSQLDGEFKRSQGNVRRLDEDLQTLQKSRDQIVGRLEEAQTSLNQRSRELRQSEETGDARNRELVELRDAVSSATRERAELLPILQRREQELTETREKLRDAMREVEGAQIAVEEKQHEIELERHNAKDLRHRFGEMERLMDSMSMEKEALRDQVAATEVDKQKALKRVNEIERAARAKIQEWVDTQKVYEATQKHLSTQRDSLVHQLEKLTRVLETHLGDLSSLGRQSSELVKTVRGSAQGDIPSELP